MKIESGIIKSIGLLVFLIVIVTSLGCTSTPKETVVQELDVGGLNTIVKYINVPSDAKIRVEISNFTVINNPSGFNGMNTLDFYGINIEGQDGQATNNYADHIIDSKSFTNLNNGFSGNNTFKSGLKSIAIVTTNSKAHIKIVTIK